MVAEGRLPGVSLSELEDGKCAACIVGKMTRRKFKRNAVRRVRDGVCMVLCRSDISGPVKPVSLGGSRYFAIVFIDDGSNLLFVSFLKTNNKVFNEFMKLEADAGTHHRRTLKAFKSDNGGEYRSKKFDELLASKGIKHLFSEPYTPEENSVAERYNRTILEGARTLLISARLPGVFWCEAKAFFVYVRNRVTSTITPDNTPWELWSGKEADLTHLRVFGSLMYAYVPDVRRDTKLSHKATSCMMVGFP